MTLDAKQLISDLEAEYDRSEGFLGLLRAGHFDSLARDRFLRLLQCIDLGTSGSIDRRVVALLWYVPLFMQWQERAPSRVFRVVAAARQDIPALLALVH